MLDKPEIRTRILELLKSYPAIKQKITVLKREFENPHLISEQEMLDTMAFAKGKLGSRSAPGHISDKTYHIAINFRGQAAHYNREQILEISVELEKMEKKIYRLEYCISQLPDEQQRAIRGTYIEKLEQKKLASELCISDSTLRRYRDKALSSLAEMYMMLIKAGVVIEW